MSHCYIEMKMKGLPVTLVQCGLWKVSLTLTVHHCDTFSGRSRPRDGHRVFRDLYWAGRWQLLLSDLWHFHTVATMSQALCKWICGCCSVRRGGAKGNDPRVVFFFLLLSSFNFTQTSGSAPAAPFPAWKMISRFSLPKNLGMVASF